MKRIPIEDAIDLHSFRPEDLASVVEEYLREARAAGFSEVRLIHGKGTGARRAQVRRLLAARSDLADYFDAPPERGGSGATIAVFRGESGGGVSSADVS
jgi:dsDNA-specific endonuclease/ATPase MutS2